MATAGGPKIVTDGLVFGYDTNYGVADNVTGTRFYTGEPVANMLNYGDNFNSWTKARNSGPNPTVDVKVKEGPFKNTLADRLSLPSDGSYPRIYQNFTPATTATHTFSVWLKGETSGQGCFVGAFRNSPWSLPSSTNFSITNEWVNYSFNINPQDTSSMQLYLGSHNSHGGKSFLIYGAQLETGSTKSVFIDGTRSSTQSLIDLKETTDISMSNVSFDSTGQPEFDGTNDYIYIDEDILNVSSFTVEAIVNITSTGNNNKPIFTCGNISSTGIWFLKHRSGLGNRLVMHGFDGVNPRVDITSTNVVPDAENAYVAVTFNGTSYQLYINGVAGLSGTTPSDSTLIIGAYSWGISSQTYYINAHQPIAKLYNQTHTATEIKQNYNAYKNRFDI